MFDQGERIAAAAAAQRSASGEVDEEQGTVRITASDVIGGEVLPSILASFHEVHPRIAAELAASNRNEDLLRGAPGTAVELRSSTPHVAARRAGGPKARPAERAALTPTLSGSSL
jgi:DNA-binding transcriptional LysR family regulator